MNEPEYYAGEFTDTDLNALKRSGQITSGISDQGKVKAVFI
jgi:hypothetical protein